MSEMIDSDELELSVSDFLNGAEEAAATPTTNDV